MSSNLIILASNVQPLQSIPPPLTSTPRLPSSPLPTHTMVLHQFGPIRAFLAIALRLSAVMLFGSILVAETNPDAEKLSAYECGFNPFGDARSRFDIRFYLVAILFIVFDLEASFLFPWAITLSTQGWLGYLTMLDFLVELVLGYIIVWKVGALEWE